jgi:hypothetical protein
MENSDGDTMAPPATTHQSEDKPSKTANRSKPVVAKKTQPRVKRALLPGTKKRKAKPLEKSTTTTTTETAQMPVNVFDAVLGEAEDLLQAAMEAQAMGRLKMASAYQLLLHARLVGLGKRFDRAQVQGLVPETAAQSPEVSMASASTASESTPVALHTELAKILPHNVEMDSAMMEHLARAAMELHHQRTGRRIQSDTVVSPPPMVAASSVAWTEEEREMIQDAVDSGTTDPAEIASILKTRTVAQVKVYLRNAEELKKGSAQMEEEFTSDLVSPRRRGGRGRKPPTQAMNTVPNAKLDAKALLAGKGL